MTQWRTHVQSSTRLTFEQNIIAPQMNFRWFSGGTELFQVAVTKFALLVSLVADSLRICNRLGDVSCARSTTFAGRIRRAQRHFVRLLSSEVLELLLIQILRTERKLRQPEGKFTNEPVRADTSLECGAWSPLWYTNGLLFKYQSADKAAHSKDVLSSQRMLRELLAGIWRRVPKRIRRWTTRLTHAQFGVTAAAIIQNSEGQVLLLKHTFRPGSGWGLPGGFLEAGEHPENALRRELLEEVGLSLGDVHLYRVRVFRRPNQLEVVFLSKTSQVAQPQSMEITKAEWFDLENLPAGLPKDQRDLIRQALTGD
jgi:mutator protein MutT